MKRKNDFLFFLALWAETASGLAGLLPRAAQSAQLGSAGDPASLAGVHPSRAARSDPLSVNPTRWEADTTQTRYHTH
jgi:hypothetical protein